MLVVDCSNLDALNLPEASLHDYWIRHVHFFSGNIKISLRYVEKRYGDPVWFEKTRELVIEGISDTSITPGALYGPGNEISNLEGVDNAFVDENVICVKLILSNETEIVFRCLKLRLSDANIIYHTE